MPKTAVPPDVILDTAQTHLGYDNLRPGQHEAIASVLDGHDTLAVMPTGSGKSAIYQVAGLILSGLTIVVSPLIALQRDQVESLHSSHEINAGELNSTLSQTERDELFTSLHSADQMFLFLAPEQLANDETLAILKGLEPSLIVIDEAHCISEWGHDFRPDYLRLGSFIAELGHPTILALTATAAGPVRDEIVERLGMRNERVFVRDFDRPNIHLSVQTFTGTDDKMDALLNFVEERKGSGIVYAATRQDTEDIAAKLVERGIDARAYHAGLKAKEREAVQDAFMGDEATVIVATIAFGMGIDKPDIRYVCHFSISESLDSYYQEIGRAGRDGDTAEALLLYDPADLNLRRFQSGVGGLNPEDVRPILATIRDADEPVNPADLTEQLALRDSELIKAIGRLDDVEAVDVAPSGEITAINTDEPVEDVAEAAAEAQAKLQQYAASRLEMMRGYAETSSCRRELLLNYFGDPYEGPCENCDRCDSGDVAVASAGDHPFPLQSTVRHTSWGEGTVMHYEQDNRITILFEEAGYRTLDLDLVAENSLLEAAD
jgi:ATP-dependent DNA helicase RecQ